ncbi:uncharacterized protein LOC125681527 isoform X2 [Ostrea edulis]|uniref:uncharacterized protein LOC125681527 isoform X2 n=1 Tax=Ostrea edulis TaxID=37623 RepID=UPI0024AFEA56|nr:uncharacterized protein LOC125681527 isoform X2 [Ostrea edulis]
MRREAVGHTPQRARSASVFVNINMNDPDRLKWPFYVLKLPQFSLSPMKLINCNGGTGFGVKFTQSSVQADYIYDTDRHGEEYGLVFPFTEIFLNGNAILMDYINLGKKPTENPKSLQVLEILLSFITHIEEAAKALQPVEKQSSSEGKDGASESDWLARLAVHFLSPLSLTQEYILDKQSSKMCQECPCRCSCKKVIPEPGMDILIS